MAIALGIDFEDITHTPAYRGLANPGDTGIDLEGVTARLLDLLDEYDISATFFIVAEIAEEQPALIREIGARGHEIASHTVSHCSLTEVEDNVSKHELVESKHLLEHVTNQEVEGFRAPTCRIDDSVYRELIEAEYSYSSSVMPSVPIPGFYSNGYSFAGSTTVSAGDRNLTEVPLSVHPTFRVPLSGAWIRLLGRSYAHHGIRSRLKADQHVVTYSHPWEFESLRETPLPFRCRVRTGDWMYETYESILSLDAEFCTVSEIAGQSSPLAAYHLSPAQR
jgi:peptidoglycan/xylan/chitin deacetylase (PgdA/CDA1 family)